MSARPESSYLKSRFGAASAQLRYLPRAAALVWRASPGWTLTWLVLLVIDGLLPVAVVLLTREAVDAVVAAVRDDGSLESVRAAALPAALLGGAMLASELVRALTAWIRSRQAEVMQDHVADLIHERSAAVDLAFYETPEYFDRLHRARNEAWYRPRRLVENAGMLVRSAITLLAMAGVLLGFSPWVPLILLASTAPALIVVLRHAARQHRWRLRNTEDERKAWYYDAELTEPHAAAEMRAFDLGGWFRRRFVEVRARLRRERLALLRSQSVSELIAALLALLATAGCMAWMGWRTVRGELTLGELALFYGAFRQGQQMMRGLLSNVGDIYRNLLFLGDVFAFLDLEPSVTSPARPRPAPDELRSGMALEGVSFAYPGSHRFVLENFDLEVPAGRITAVVGPNGSGKSTLIKLLARLYDPDSGRVSMDGVDLRRLEIGELRRRITAMFQSPVRYSVPVERGISFGDLPAEPGPDEVARAARAAGAERFISELPQGYRTLLGKWFDGGTELSDGEWQRLALARAFLRRAQLVLLDEPTSAMDSWAEAEWMERLRELVRGRTALIITHRFTTAMRADLICVMEGGSVIESGTHAELVKSGGRYADSWRRQQP